MDMKKLQIASTVEHEFFDGTKVKCTLAMYLLRNLAGQNKALFDTVMKVVSKGTEDFFEMVRVVYAAYVCANMNSEESLMSEDEFLAMCGSDFTGVGQTFRTLVDPKKRMASGGHSN